MNQFIDWEMYSLHKDPIETNEKYVLTFIHELVSTVIITNDCK